MSREVLQMALEAQERMKLSRDYARLPGYPLSDADRQMEKSTAALREALAQPEQEPVAWLRADGMKAMEADEKESWIEAKRPELVAEYTIPLYTSPPQRQPLTNEEIDAAVKAWFENDIVAGRQPFAKRMRAAFKAAHGIKGAT